MKYCSDKDKRKGRVWANAWNISSDVNALTYDQLRPWQKEIYDNLLTEPDDRTINWVCDTAGNQGKTALCKSIIANFTDVLFLSSSNTKDACHQIIKREKPYKIALVNLPRQAEGHVSYAAYESIKDGLVYSGKYDGGHKLFRSPHLYIFANWKPDVQALSQDRWNIIYLG